ncbi:MAG: sensor histidine kinase [Alphaproteobacteria bacterium]|nr:sensor histidine kinase [Alphaproteobacteria bacterium]
MIFINNSLKRIPIFFSYLKSSIVRKLLLVNLVAPILLVVGLLSMGHYKTGLINAEIKTLKAQAELMSIALSEGAVISETLNIKKETLSLRKILDGFILLKKIKTKKNNNFFKRNESKTIYKLLPDESNRILKRLTSLDSIQVRLFNHNGLLIANTNTQIQTSKINKKIVKPYFFNVHKKFENENSLNAFDFEEVGIALGNGSVNSEIRFSPSFGYMLSVAVPVIFENQILGAILINGSIDNILSTLIAIQFGIFRLFFTALIITLLLSLFIIRTIILPIEKLSKAAVQIKTSGGRRTTIPNETKRKDEIGVLSASLIKMTDTLWEKIDATEKFASDVSHELKNPLSSMKSALETIDYIHSTEKKEQLLSIVKEDVSRMNRLITDISNLSKIDAELSREEFEKVNMHTLLTSLINGYNLAADTDSKKLSFILNWDQELEKNIFVLGMESRIAQVFYNLIGNAISFSPTNGTITINVSKQNSLINVSILDEGCGIPEGDEKKLFQRFYCQRPTSEKFGKHSGLGLSISEKIVAELNGTISAENRKDSTGKICGAIFSVQLPIDKE